MKKQTKKIGALALTGLVGLAGIGIGAVGGSQLFPKTITEEVVVTELIEKEVIVTEQIEVPVNVTVEKEVLVDNGNLDLVLEHIYDNNGEVVYLTEDLFDDELDQIVERIVLVNDMKSEAVNVVLSQFSRELDRQHNFDRRDISRVKVDKDSVEISNVNFKHEDSLVTMEVEFRYDGSLKTAEVEVEFYDGKVLPIVIQNVN